LVRAACPELSMTATTEPRLSVTYIMSPCALPVPLLLTSPRMSPCWSCSTLTCSPDAVV